MFNIRKNTFETNSSSTHSICICKEDEYIEIPKKIEIDLTNYNYEFGWEYERWDTPEEKLAYLILGIIGRSYAYTSLIEACGQIEKIIDKLSKIGVESIHIRGIDFIFYDGDKYLSAYESFVDHASELGDLIERVLYKGYGDEDYLKNYLFSDKSFILGGNDNEDGYQEIKVDYPHIEIEKGN